MPGQERIQFLATVADLYYIEGMSQAQIARRFGYSRSAISRLLTEARDLGIVEISINHPLQRIYTLEHKLRSIFGLTDVRVAHRGMLNYQRTLRLLGKLGANYLTEELPDGAILGISWGTAAHEVSQALNPRSRSGMHVVQMIGSLGYGDPQIDGSEVVRSIANKLGAQHHSLDAPLLVRDQVGREALLNERRIRATLDMALNANFALVGIGSVVPQRSSLLRAGYLDNDDLELLKRQGAVGDICVTHYNIDGNILDLNIHNRLIGVDLQSLNESPCKIIGVAAGKMKAPAILGALRGGFLDVLITDSTAAEEILSLNSQKASTAQLVVR
ncbi:MAG: sugar-binding protein [Ardenticatenaceae bacterium]|nr:MAG: sugar-binding protein [Ardenticatenaceae bacterium]